MGELVSMLPEYIFVKFPEKICLNPDFPENAKSRVCENRSRQNLAHDNAIMFFSEVVGRSRLSLAINTKVVQVGLPAKKIKKTSNFRHIFRTL